MDYEHQLPKVKSATANPSRSRGIILLHLFVIVHSEGFHPKSTLVRYEQEVKIKQPVLGKEANRKDRDLRVCKLSQQINSHLFKSAFIFLEKKKTSSFTSDSSHCFRKHLFITSTHLPNWSCSFTGPSVATNLGCTITR